MLVSSEDHPGPKDRVYGPYAVGLWPHPKFEILDPVVCPQPVPVVDVLIRHQMPPEEGFHHQDVFEDVSMCSRSGMFR